MNKTRRFCGVCKTAILATGLMSLSACGLLSPADDSFAQQSTNDIFANPQPLTNGFGANGFGAPQAAGQIAGSVAGGDAGLFQQVPGVQTPGAQGLGVQGLGAQTFGAQTQGFQSVVAQAPNQFPNQVGQQQGVLPNAVAGFQQVAPEYQVSPAAWGQQVANVQVPAQQQVQQFAPQQFQGNQLQFPQAQAQLQPQFVQQQQVAVAPQQVQQFGQVQPMSFDEFVTQQQADLSQTVQNPQQQDVQAFAGAGQQSATPNGVAPNPYVLENQKAAQQAVLQVNAGLQQAGGLQAPATPNVSSFAPQSGASQPTAAQAGAVQSFAPTYGNASFCADLGELNAQVTQILAPIGVLPYGNERGDGISFEIPFQSVAGGKSIKNAEYVLPEIARLVQPYDTLFVQVLGHTTKTGKDAVELVYTDTLSIYIAKQLIDRGVDAQRIQTRGFGSRKPSAFGNNERAEFRLTTARNCSPERLAERAAAQAAALAAQQQAEYAAALAAQQQAAWQAQQQQQLQLQQQAVAVPQVQYQYQQQGQVQQFVPQQQGVAVQQQFDPYAFQQQVQPQFVSGQQVVQQVPAGYQVQQVPQQVPQQLPQSVPQGFTAPVPAPAGGTAIFGQVQ